MRLWRSHFLARKAKNAGDADTKRGEKGPYDEVGEAFQLACGAQAGAARWKKSKSKITNLGLADYNLKKP